VAGREFMQTLSQNKPPAPAEEAAQPVNKNLMMAL
jgi:hypothetical protein